MRTNGDIGPASEVFSALERIGYANETSIEEILIRPNAPTGMTTVGGLPK